MYIPRVFVVTQATEKWFVEPLGHDGCSGGITDLVPHGQISENFAPSLLYITGIIDLKKENISSVL